MLFKRILVVVKVWLQGFVASIFGATFTARVAWMYPEYNTFSKAYLKMFEITNSSLTLNFNGVEADEVDVADSFDYILYGDREES